MDRKFALEIFWAETYLEVNPIEIIQRAEVSNGQ